MKTNAQKCFVPEGLYLNRDYKISYLPVLCLIILYLGPTVTCLQAQAYKGPLVITKGGTYKGNWESKDSETAAIEIRTSDAVIIENSNIRSAGPLIRSIGYSANITVRHTNGYGTTPTPWKDYMKPRRFLAVDGFKNIVVENCYMEGTAGIYIGYRYEGNGTTANTIKIRYNNVKNIDGRVFEGKAIVQFVQFNFRNAIPHVEIAWNQVINEPNKSAIEDNISIYNSRGTANSPIRIHNNFIKGAYPIPHNTTYFTGGGIITDGDGDDSTCPAFVDASNNQLINLGNHCMGIAGGNNIRFHHNRAINSALFSDGTRFEMYTSGLWSKDYYGMNTTYANNIDYNTIGVTSWGRINDRNDISVAENATYLYNSFLEGGAVPTTVESEEYNKWTQKLRTSGVNIGPRGGLTKNTNKSPLITLSSPLPDATFSAGSTITIAADASDPNGYITRVEFFNGSIKLGESNATHSFNWENIKAGTYSISAKATDNQGGTQTSAAVTVNVTSDVVTSGSISRELWSNIPGGTVKDIPVSVKPSAVSELKTFEAPINSDPDYGQRIRGYVTAPETGLYTFWIDGDKSSEVWLSTSEDPKDKVKMATMYNPWVHPREWPMHPSHQSNKVALEKGKHYYIEALMKKDRGPDHLAVGWQLPDGTMERPIQGNRLSPFTNQTFQVSGQAAMSGSNKFVTEDAFAYPNPFKETITLELGAEMLHLQEVKLINYAGQTVYSNSSPEPEGRKLTIKLSSANIAPGLYFLKLTGTAGENKIIKILKE